MAYKRLRGTHDLYAEESLFFHRAESLAARVFVNFGFEEMRTPLIEEAALFSRALGADTDVVKKEMYTFEDRSRTRVALRPEGTAGIVRAYLENKLDKSCGHCKFFYAGPMFRSERPQAGRQRQFHQIGVEQLGTDSPYADAESIHCLTEYLDKAGAGGYTLKLNNLGTFEERDAYKKKLLEYARPLAKKLCEDCRGRLERNVLRVLDCKNPECRRVLEKAPPIAEGLSEASRDHYQRVLEALSQAGIPYAEDKRLVRGLDYYTKTVFEVTHPKLGAQDALAAGGRYDHLIESMGGYPAGAIGFAIGTERLRLAAAVPPGTCALPPLVFVVALGEAALKKGFELLSALRNGGMRSEMDFQSKSMKSQMRSADKRKASLVVILGDNELQKNQFILKNMQSGAQAEHPLAGAAERIGRELVVRA